MKNYVGTIFNKRNVDVSQKKVFPNKFSQVEFNKNLTRRRMKVYKFYGCTKTTHQEKHLLISHTKVTTLFHIEEKVQKELRRKTTSFLYH
jgi:hypothetical protein